MAQLIQNHSTSVQVNNSELIKPTLKKKGNRVDAYKKQLYKDFVDQSVAQLREITKWCNLGSPLTKKQREKLGFEASHIVKKVANQKDKIQIAKGYYI